MTEETQQTCEPGNAAKVADPPSAPASPTPESKASQPQKRAPKVAESKAKPPAKSSAVEPSDPPSDKNLAGEETARRVAELEALIADLQGKSSNIESEMANNRQAMRNSVLDGLGVLGKYRQYAPEVDPFTDDGRAALEAWATENPELLSARPTPVVEVDTEKVKSNMRSPHLVDFKTFSKSMKGGA